MPEYLKTLPTDRFDYLSGIPRNNGIFRHVFRNYRIRTDYGIVAEAASIALMSDDIEKLPYLSLHSCKSNNKYDKV